MRIFVFCLYMYIFFVNLRLCIYLSFLFFYFFICLFVRLNFNTFAVGFFSFSLVSPVYVT